jgi:hypothetical protein
MNVSIEYIAGLFDGEGNPYIVLKKYPKICITITNTNKEVLEIIQRTLGYGKVKERSLPKNRINWSRCYCFRIGHRQEAKDFLKRIIPYLIIKKAECEKGLKIIEEFQYKNADLKQIPAKIVKNYHKHFSIREIAILLNISIGSVHHKLHEN